jgi:hypothetical protein
MEDERQRKNQIK